MADRPVAFDRAGAKRIVAAVRRVEAMVQSKDPRQKRRAVLGGGPSVVEGVVTRAITAASGTTYGSGGFTPYVNTSGTGAADPVYDTDLNILNWLPGTGTIAIGVHITAFLRNGEWQLLTAGC